MWIKYYLHHFWRCMFNYKEEKNDWGIAGGKVHPFTIKMTWMNERFALSLIHQIGNCHPFNEQPKDGQVPWINFGI